MGLHLTNYIITLRRNFKSNNFSFLKLIGAGVIAYVLFSLSSCKNEKLGEDLAKAYCGACHLVPDPKLLDKKTWQENVLPYMAVWVGRRSLEDLPDIPYEDIARIHASDVLPRQAVISDEKWAAIVKYYVDNAPEKLPILKDTNTYLPLENKFTIKPLPIESSGVSMVHFDHRVKQLMVANLDNDFIIINPTQNTIAERTKTASPAVAITNEPDSTLGLTLAGEMNPNDGLTGMFGWARLQNQRFESKHLVKKLSRPVCSVITDVNADGKKDVVIASFGNFIGNLAWYEWNPDGSTQQHIIKDAAGALQIVAKDMNQDKHTDLVVLWGQGDEGISIFYNNGQGRFREEKVVRYPSVYGSISMQLVDFDQDGKEDILYTNGDNGDESRILKPYHGVRILLNKGKNKFEEKYFFPIHGTIKSMATDFDKDGDLDIVAISFFPDYNLHPNKTLVYLENKGNWNFTPYTSAKTDIGRWMVMDVADYNSDGYADVIVGSCKELPEQKEALKNNNRVWILEYKK